MQELERVETVELDGGRSVQLEYGRRWPKYIVAWSIRQQSGESNFPVASGEVESMPPKAGVEVDVLWDDLREKALGASREFVPAHPERSERPRSFMDRLLGRD